MYLGVPRPIVLGPARFGGEGLIETLFCIFDVPPDGKSGWPAITIKKK